VPDLNQPSERLDAHARETGCKQTIQRVPMAVAHGGADDGVDAQALTKDVGFGQGGRN
jgi:hypothetical protein